MFRILAKCYVLMETDNVQNLSFDQIMDQSDWDHAISLDRMTSLSCNKYIESN